MNMYPFLLRDGKWNHSPSSKFLNCEANWEGISRLNYHVTTDITRIHRIYDIWKIDAKCRKMYIQPEMDWFEMMWEFWEGLGETTDENNISVSWDI